MAAKKKSYTVDAWRHDGGDSSWYRLQLGKLYYTNPKKKPAGFGYAVARWNPSFKQNYATGGWDDIERAEIDVDAYHGVVRAYVDTSPGNELEGVYFGAIQMLYGYAVQRCVGAEVAAGSIYTLNRELEARKVLRASASGTLYVGKLFEELTAHADIFTNVLLAMEQMNAEQRDTFVKQFVRYTMLDHRHSPNQQLLRECFARMVVAWYPEKANPAAASVLVDSFDFEAEDNGVMIFSALANAFGPNVPTPESFELPADFSS